MKKQIEETKASRDKAGLPLQPAKQKRKTTSFCNQIYTFERTDNFASFYVYDTVKKTKV